VEWFTAAGDIYHRECSGEIRWTSSRDLDGKCVGCGKAIPDEIMTVAKGQSVGAQGTDPPPSDPSRPG
jgi:hypothetical protein